jgi:excisionase family DNA binding protein
MDLAECGQNPHAIVDHAGHFVEMKQLLADGAVSVPEFCRLTSLGRSATYALMKSNRLRYVKLGKRRAIPRSEVVRILTEGFVGLAPSERGLS